MTQIQFNNMMQEALEGTAGTEVVLSHVVLPPRFALPKHRHPGEEFADIHKGSLTLWQDGAEELTLSAGDVGKVPYKVVHTIRTGEDGVELIVFRVHEEGQPERPRRGRSAASDQTAGTELPPAPARSTEYRPRNTRRAR